MLARKSHWRYLSSMKHVVPIIVWLVSSPLFAQGNFASSQWKALIGKTCKNENEFSQLKEFISLGGTLLSDINDPEKKIVALFAKGSTVIVLFEVMTDNRITVLDVVEANNVQKNQEIKIGVCREESDNPNIVALVEQSKQERWKALKAWHFNLDKIRVESWPHANVTCLGIEGDD